MLEVVRAEYVADYKVRICFNTGEEGIVDLSEALWGPVFEPLRNPEAFRRFEVSDVLHTIHWENDADFAPEFLHDKMIEHKGQKDRLAAVS
jgi:hypothetical protein